MSDVSIRLGLGGTNLGESRREGRTGLGVTVIRFKAASRCFDSGVSLIVVSFGRYRDELLMCDEPPSLGEGVNGDVYEGRPGK